ncbi:MAG: hypothetical protein LBS60_11685 [Deltaproteobacteria bacterium]|nr:hypothetical protein [Deltaproteobacteria bacterium]
MYIERFIRGGQTTVLLRESRRERKKIIKTTLANLSKLDSEVINNIELALKGQKLVAKDSVIDRLKRRDMAPCGQVEAVRAALERLSLFELIDPIPSLERTIVLGLVAAGILQPPGEPSTLTES